MPAMQGGIVKWGLGLVAAAGIWMTTGAAIFGGGGPENVLVVANPKSPTSLAIANAYTHLRKIPTSNVVYVSFDPVKQKVDVDEFRKSILRPVIDAINQRHLAAQIDIIAYSSDFPWCIDVQSDVKSWLNALPTDARHEWPKVLTQAGSLTGLTCLWQPVMAKSVEYMGLGANRYALKLPGGGSEIQTRSFHGRMQFDAKGNTVDSAGQSFFLSVLLGATAGSERRGNTPVEVFTCLARSAAADGTRPSGVFYFTRTQDVRTKTRADEFSKTVHAIEALGMKAEIIPSALPQNRPDVLGITLGTANFDWPASRSRLLPGAICDNLTSTGGSMYASDIQTPLTEFLRRGAAGASGTVVEPFAIAPKFPSPMLHVHYARGCSLAEAFYQSIPGPYQLLIVGDPLCQPWARLPQVSVAGVEPGGRVQGKLELKPSATLPEEAKPERFELFVDGLLVGTEKPGDAFSLDTATLPDGWHELRVVAVGPGPIHSRGRKIVFIQCANHGRSIEASCSPATVPVAGSLAVTAKCPGASRIVIYQNGQMLGRIDGASGRFEVQAAKLGAGPVRLEAIGYFAGSIPQDRVLARPLRVTVQWPNS